ncbi:acyl carrier protein 4, chloroplastic [Carica papaya]|uniref:acyl carrier protein 4, chloroplastic n=1 Tax=Carica papaya TaxID=3649 RepID=UPI000B8C8348|nr:acyl carrier protein 4, chloroplastic [Carica papaya]
MASISATCLSFKASSTKFNSRISQVGISSSRSKLISYSFAKGLKASRFRISCAAAKPETVEKVCEIVRKQLALKPEIQLTPETKFTDLGADSLDTVEIVMGLEEEFNINIEEDSSQNIATVQDAANLIEEFVQKKAEAS